MSNPTADAVIKQADQYLGSRSDEKWTPEAKLVYLNTAIGQLFALRPSAFYVTQIIVTPPASVGLTDEIAVFPRFAEPLAHFVAAQCLIEESNDEFAAKMAKSHIDLFASLSA